CFHCRYDRAAGTANGSRWRDCIRREGDGSGQGRSAESGRNRRRRHAGNNGRYTDQENQTGKVMITRGLEGVVANTTRLSDVIGDKGQLIYAGYDINELAGKVSYEEAVYLLLINKLPNRTELDRCGTQLRRAGTLPKALRDFSKSPAK